MVSRANSMLTFLTLQVIKSHHKLLNKKEIESVMDWHPAIIQLTDLMGREWRKRQEITRRGQERTVET